MSKRTDSKATLRIGTPEIVVRVDKLPAMRAFGLYARLARAIVPALQDGIDPKADLMVLVVRVMAHLSPDEAQELVREVFRGCTTATVNGIKHDLDDDDMINEVFTGRVHDLIRAAVHAIQVNFAGFTGASENSTAESKATETKAETEDAA